MAKKKNSRKALAVALAVVGVAGLSIASASTLTITPPQNIATGNVAVTAACDAAVTAAFNTAWNTGTKVHDISGINVTNISPTCNGLDIVVTAFNGATQLGTASGELDASEEFLAAMTIAGTATVTDISITIS